MAEKKCDSGNIPSGIAFAAGFFLTWGIVSSLYPGAAGLLIGLGVGFLLCLLMKMFYRKKK
jgi:hypothetical protein